MRIILCLLLVFASVCLADDTYAVLPPDGVNSLRSHMAAIRPDYSIWRMFRILRSLVESRDKRPENDLASSSSSSSSASSSVPSALQLRQRVLYNIIQ